MSDSGNPKYQGYQDAGSSLGELNTRDFQIQQSLAEVRTAIVVKIVRAPYNADGNAISPGSPAAIGYVDVLPLVNQVDGLGNATPHTTVYRLSYHRYQGGHGAFISDPKVGDIGKMVNADRDTSVVRATSKQSNPGSRRRHDMADGTYFGQTQSGAPSQWFAFLEHGFNCTDSFGNTMIGNSEGVVVNGVTITRSGEIRAPGNVFAGYGTGDQVDLQQHRHANSGGTGPDDPPIPGS